MTTMKPLRLFCAVASVALATVALAADPLRMDMRSTFTGPMAGTSAVTVLLENDGPDARGVVRVSGDQGETVYPVELPRGARKRLLTLPANQWSEVSFSLETNQGVVRRRMPGQMMGYQNGGTVLLIGDDEGGLGFLRKQTDGKAAISTGDAYVKAEDAPDRPVAYQPFNAVALGPGSERLNDGTVRALRDYALGGGTLLFFGGASAPTLDDARWTRMLPGKGWHPATLNGSPVLSDIVGSPMEERFTVLTPGSVAPGAKLRREGATILESQRGFGLGRVVVLGYSPLEQPLSLTTGRAKAISRFIRGAEAQRAQQFRAAYLRQSANEEQYYGGGTVAPMAAMPPGSVAATPGYTGYSRLPSSGDPFSTTLPPTASVFGLLAIYFVLVVPVSFLVLRKMKRGELAWVTAPLLSLGFAGLLFKSAQGLYSAALSTASQGVVVLQEGSPDGMFFGTSQMFFPRGGTYDLGLRGVDSMSAVNSSEDYYRGRSDALAGFNPVDVGEVIAPRLEANNLAFRELSYVQRVDGADWFSIDRVDANHASVENRSPFDFEGSLVNGVFEGEWFKLAPGQKRTVELRKGRQAMPAAGLPVNDPLTFTRGSGRMALRGRLSGFRPGPQVGQEVKNRSGIDLLAFAEETVR